MGKLEKYSSYKDSGVEWLGVIPKHWEIEKFKYLFHEKKKTYDINLNCGSISFGKVVEKNDERIPVSTKASYQVLNKGEFLINPLNLNYDLKSLRIGLSDLDVVVSSGYLVVKNKQNIDKKYFNYLLHRYDVAYMKTLGAGVRQTLNFNDLSNTFLVTPPKQEQTKIASFLDKKTAQIDEVISQKEKLIELLKERKQIVINDAVTKGLDKDVEFVDSGVEWIGKIPNHWEVKKMKYFIDIKGGFAFDSMAFQDSGIQIIKIANTYMNKLSLDRQPTFVNESYLKSHSDWVVSKGDILMSLTGTMGKKDYGFAILLNNENKYLLNQRVAKLNVKNNMSSDYLLTILHSDMYLNQLYSLPSGTKQANLSNNNVIEILMPIPPVDEREKICTFIKNKSEKIDKAIEQQQNYISKLKEYKASLIDSVVTGKVRIV